MSPLGKLKTAYENNKIFTKVLAIALVINLLFAGAFVFTSIMVKDITVSVNGKSIKYRTMAKTVDDMLSGWGVNLDEGDVVAPGQKAKLKDDMDVSIDLYEVETEVVKEATDFKQKEEYTSDLLEGEEKVTTKGVKGQDEVTYEVTYLGGEEQSRKEVDRKTIKKPKTQILSKGTAIAIDGERYSRKLVVQATAYSGGGTTATGTRARVGEIAVDPRVIPLGSECYIEGFGKVRAEDTGGAVKGNIIDIYMASRGAAIRWGRRTVTIYIK